VLKWFYFSDMQIPDQDDKAIDLAFKVLKWFKPHVVVNIGDLANGSGTSRWANGTTEEVLASIMEENTGVIDYWRRVKKAAPRARLIWTGGNHCSRPFDYVDKKAPALRELVTPESLWQVDKLGIEYYDYSLPPQVKMGDVYVHHGVAVSKHAGDSARMDIESFGVSLVRGHSHRASSFAKTYELRNETLWGYEIGHLMDVSKADYSQVHNWQQAFAVGYEEDGHGHIDIIPIHPGYVCYYGGRKFSLDEPAKAV